MLEFLMSILKNNYFFKEKRKKILKRETFKRFHVKIDESSIAYIIHYVFRFGYQRIDIMI